MTYPKDDRKGAPAFIKQSGRGSKAADEDLYNSNIHSLTKWFQWDWSFQFHDGYNSNVRLLRSFILNFKFQFHDDTTQTLHPIGRLWMTLFFQFHDGYNSNEKEDSKVSKRQKFSIPIWIQLKPLPTSKISQGFPAFQ